MSEQTCPLWLLLHLDRITLLLMFIDNLLPSAHSGAYFIILRNWLHKTFTTWSNLSGKLHPWKSMVWCLVHVLDDDNTVDSRIGLRIKSKVKEEWLGFWVQSAKFKSNDISKCSLQIANIEVIFWCDLYLTKYNG